EDFRHQSVDRAAQRGELLQDRRTVAARLHRALERVHLAADAAQAGGGALLVLRRMRHRPAALRILVGSIRKTGARRGFARVPPRQPVFWMPAEIPLTVDTSARSSASSSRPP